MAIWLTLGATLAFVALLCGILLVQRRREEAAPEPPGMPPDLPGLLAWTQKRGACRKCGQRDGGTTYRFHYGVYRKPIFKLLRATEYLYDVQGDVLVFICDACVKKRVARVSLRNAILLLPPGVLVLLVFLFRLLFVSGTTIQDLLTPSGWFGIAFAVLVIFFGGMGLYRTFRPNAKRSSGEQLAIKLLRYPIRKRTGATHFWDSYAFGRLRPWPGERQARSRPKR